MSETMNKKVTEIAGFDGGCDRTGRIWVMDYKCDVCGDEEVEVLSMDGSEAEYSAGAICLKCIQTYMRIQS